MLHILSDKKRRAFYESQLGRVATVLFEDDLDEVTGRMQGFTENYVRVVANYDPIRINELIPIQLSTINTAGLMEVCEPEMSFESSLNQTPDRPNRRLS